MKFCRLVASGVVLLCSSVVSSNAMEDFCPDEKEEIFDIVDHFKQNLSKYNWLNPDYKELFSNLPSAKEFAGKWDNYKNTMKSLQNIDDIQFRAIQNKAKDFYKKHLGADNIIYDIICYSIDIGRYREEPDFYELSGSEMFLDFDYLYNISSIKYNVNGSYENKNRMRRKAQNQLHGILTNYINDFAYRAEKVEELKLTGKPKEYEWEIFKQYKNKLGDFASKHISVDFFDNFVLPRMRKNYSYDWYREILKETNDRYCTLHKHHTGSDEIWCLCQKNFYQTHRIFVKYRGEADLLSKIVHETGHVAADADVLMANDKQARMENVEAVAMYFETLLYDDKEHAEHNYVKIDRLYPLYADLASIISVGKWFENMALADVKDILNLKNMNAKKKTAYVMKNRDLCKQALETYKLLQERLEPDIASHEFRETDEEREQSEDEKLANQLVRIFDQFCVDSNNGNIEFEFGAHTKALFHAFKVKEQAEKQKWNLDKVMCELSCTKMQRPTLEEFQKVIDWLMN